MTVRSIDGMSIIQQYNHGSSICTTSFGPDGTLLAIGGELSFVVIDVLSGAVAYNDPREYFHCDFFCHKAGDNRLLLARCCAEGGHAEVRNLHARVAKQHFADTGSVDSVLYSPGDYTVA
jgi:hypothetical protein